MNLIDIFRKFPTEESCYEHLERVRFGDYPYCPRCGGMKVARKADGHRVGRWNCYDCHASFNVLSGTIFQKTRIPLQKWFLGIGLMVNAKKSVSSCQLGRDLDMTQQSAWFMQQRIRAEMATDQCAMLHGIVEADETYIGGKPRKGNKRDDDLPTKRGRGTAKTPVIGAVERHGNVVARVADQVGDLTGRGILRFVQSNIDPVDSILITDEFSAYNAVRPIMRHAVINHSRQYVNGDTHTNTIESFWALVKRAWMGTHHHYTRKHLPLFIAESCWKYNNRRNGRGFDTFIRACFA